MAAKTAGTWRVIAGKSRVGYPTDLSAVDSVQKFNLGTRVRARDVGTTAYGRGEFIYLAGGASVARGLVCLITDAYAVSLAAAREKGALCVALGTVTAGLFGWFQIRGTGVVGCGTVLANAPLYLAGSGTVDDDAVAGDQVIGMRTVSTDDTSTCVATMVTYPATADFDNA